MVPLSALKGSNLEVLERAIMDLLPEGELIFPEEQVTDRPMRFMAATTWPVVFRPYSQPNCSPIATRTAGATWATTITFGS